MVRRSTGRRPGILGPMSGIEIEGWDRWTPPRVLAVAVLVATFGVWIYAYSGLAARDAPDTMDDPSYAALAEPICAEAKDELAGLPGALEATSPQERADQIRKADLVLDRMVSELEDLNEPDVVPGTERDKNIVRVWLERWRVLIADREDYADRIAEDPNAQFYISAEAGRRAEKSIAYVAETNHMPSCTLPNDVG